jgi:hypothetical protein
VAIRGAGLDDNFCACPDFATNGLGTCKHIEFTLGRLATKRGGTAALARGFEATWSEIYLRYAALRRLCFRVGVDCPPQLAQQVATALEGQGSQVPDLDALLQAAAKLGHELRCYDDARSFVAERRGARRFSMRLTRKARRARNCVGCSRPSSTLTRPRAHCLPHVRAARLSATRWAWARRSRPSPLPSCWCATVGPSAC